MKKNKCFGAIVCIFFFLGVSFASDVTGLLSKSYSKKILGRSVTVLELSGKVSDAHIALGENKVGSVESMKDMVEKNKALAAVNGTFFNAYEKSGPLLPNGTLINQGELIHKYDNGTNFMLSSEGTPMIGQIKIPITATAESTNHTVGVYGINRKLGADGIYLYTDKWLGELNIPKARLILVNKTGEVISQTLGKKVGIPEGGFVLAVTGTSDSLIRFANACSKGSKVGWTYEVTGLEDTDIKLAVGAGPLVLVNSKTITDLEAYKEEGFTEAKILTQSAGRTAIGIRKNGDIVIVTTVAKVTELGAIMKELGCEVAMNLDGGASSGLFAKGKMITTPGRKLSNIHYFK